MKRFFAFLAALVVLLVGDLPASAAPTAPASPAVPTAPTSPAASTPPYHVVRPGETIKEIAAAYGITRTQLRAWNGIVKPHQPSVDGVLHVAKPPVALTGWRSWIEKVTPAAVNWDPKKKCPVLPTNLRKVWVTYIDFYGVARTGSIVVNKAIAKRIQRAFRSLYRMRFRLMGMSPMSINAPWITDMATVTAGYSCRRVAGSKTLSQHAYGLAIDVNPVQNPMVRGSYIDPGSGADFLARGPYRRGMMHARGAVRAFTTNGLHWGGRWQTLKDYMHFSTTDR
ncbi:M15 family metallopeptidase [Actinoplanes sp. NPDC051346]|uniref:M15 family metallopeptidase n=1 Tax=Actinoplanes sp. NPDC051346 TaxID=3155048 RepID=UPI003424F259